MARTLPFRSNPVEMGRSHEKTSGIIAWTDEWDSSSESENEDVQVLGPPPKLPRAFPLHPHALKALTDVKKPEGRKPCDHSRLDLYLEPCMLCQKFCNCKYSYFPIQYPDVLVRSLDMKIVRLSQAFVRSTSSLFPKVDAVFRRALQEEMVEDEAVIQYGRYIDASIVVDWEPEAPARMNPAQKFFTQVLKANEATVPDLIQLGRDDKVLVLFDPEEPRKPTLPIKKDTLQQVDYYMNMHLDQVDRRVEACRRAEEYFGDSGKKDLNLAEAGSPVAYEEWEEEFFNTDTVQFLALHQANQELLIWDLFYALEKWTMLGRGFPQPKKTVRFADSDEGDIRSTSSTNQVTRYTHPKRWTNHGRNPQWNRRDFNRVGFQQPRWWSPQRASRLDVTPSMASIVVSYHKELLNDLRLNRMGMS